MKNPGADIEALLFLPTVENFTPTGTWHRRANLDLWAQYDLAAMF